MSSVISAGTSTGSALNFTGDTSGSLALATNNGVTAVTIDTSQNVGIGTTSIPSTVALGIYRGAGLASKIELAGNGNTLGSSSFQISQGSSSVAYLWQWAAQPLILATSGTEAIRIDASGNVGIGTSTASNLLTLGASGGPTQRFTDTSSGAFSLIQVGSNGDFIISADHGNTGAATNIIFKTDGANERMRLASNGYVGIGISTNTDHPLLVSSYTSDFAISAECTHPSNPMAFEARYTAAAPNNSGVYFFLASDTSATRMQIRSNGGIANYSGNNVNLSDIREKTNIELAGSYLNKICDIPVKTFNYIDQNHEEDGGLTLGVVAQDVQAVAPELVMESNWGTKDEPKLRLSIYQTDLQYALMKSIQELKQIVDTQATEIAALKAKVGA